MRERLSSPRFVSRLTWAGALILVAGIVTVGVVVLGNTNESEPRVAGAITSAPDDSPIQEVASPGTRRTVPLATEARRVAGEFILSAVTREDLAKAWTLTHPDLKAECQCTRSEWLTGNIPIQPYPGSALDDASFAIEESYEDEVWLEVALLPKEGSDVPSEIFKIGLKRVGKGSSARWLVAYWAPRATLIVPVPD